jgi:hypothetical protein
MYTVHMQQSSTIHHCSCSSGSFSSSAVLLAAAVAAAAVTGCNVCVTHVISRFANINNLSSSAYSCLWVLLSVADSTIFEQTQQWTCVQFHSLVLLKASTNLANTLQCVCGTTCTH